MPAKKLTASAISLWLSSLDKLKLNHQYTLSSMHNVAIELRHQGKHAEAEEMHREANTLGSKSSSLELTRISVDMKVLIEQMREQVQNIE